MDLQKKRLRLAKERRPKKKFCVFCAEKVEEIDYKEMGRLRKYLTEKGKIIPRRVTGNCAKHQRALARAIKRAREVALIPYTSEQR
jgi:small subunit ribosomal protein S18